MAAFECTETLLIGRSLYRLENVFNKYLYRVRMQQLSQLSTVCDVVVRGMQHICTFHIIPEHNRNVRINMFAASLAIHISAYKRKTKARSFYL